MVLEELAMRPMGDDEVVRRQYGENENATLVRNLLLRVPLHTDPQMPIDRSDPPSVPVVSSAIPSTSLSL